MTPFSATLLSSDELETLFAARVTESARNVANVALNYTRTLASHQATLQSVQAPGDPPEGLSAEEFAGMYKAMPKNSEMGVLAAWVELLKVQAIHAALIAERDRLTKSPAPTA